MKKALWGSLLAATALTPGVAYAQEGDATSQDEEVSIVEENAGIIVTARRREESLQKVPTSVAVATAETIERLNLNNFADIAQTTAGLIFDESNGRGSGAAFRPVIRGQANILGDSGVAVFIDGIYFDGPISDYDVDSVDRIEVVKGPQSALYGRNTYSGAINIVSKIPGDTWEGQVTADIAEFDRYELTGAIRGPITDGLTFGVNARYYDFGGEFTNAFDGEKLGQQSSWSASGILALDNGGPFRATLRGYYNRTDDGQPAIFQQGTLQNNCLFDDGSLYGGGGRYFCGIIEPGELNSDFSRQFSNPSDVGLQADTYNVAFRWEYDLSDDLRLVSLTGYNSRVQTTRTDGDYGPNSFQTAVFARFPFAGFPVPPFDFAFVGTTVDFSFANRNESEDVSQELRLEYTSDAFDFILGGYIFDQKDNDFTIRDVPSDAAARAGASFGAAFGQELGLCAANPICGSVVPFFGPSVPNDRSENLLDVQNRALFGAVNWHITPEINLGIEGRYAEEEISIRSFDFNEGDARPDPTIDSRTFREFTPRVTFDWQFADQSLFYAMYAEGQKPGGFNGALAIAASADDPTVDVATFEAEDNTSYEVGFKNTLFDGRIIFNLAAFYTEIEGYQLTQNVEVPPNQISVTTNAGEAEIWGIEAELVAEMKKGITLTANYSFADSEFTSGVDENQGVLNDVADDRLVNCSTGDQFPSDDDCQSLFGSIAGQRIPRAPRHRIFADIDMRGPTQIGNGDWEFFTGANVTFTSTSFAQVHNLAETGSAIEVDARMGLQNGNYRVQFYVNNLFDEDAVQQIIRYADADASFRRSFIAGLRPGRRFGVVLSARY